MTAGRRIGRIVVLLVLVAVIVAAWVFVFAANDIRGV